jgi:hypothetical protein
MPSYGTQNIPVFCVEIKFEWLLRTWVKNVLKKFRPLAE